MGKPLEVSSSFFNDEMENLRGERKSSNKKLEARLTKSNYCVSRAGRVAIRPDITSISGLGYKKVKKQCKEAVVDWGCHSVLSQGLH